MNTPFNPGPHGVAKAGPSIFGLHPLIAAAAAAVIAVCGVGIATMLTNRTGAVAPPQPVALVSTPTAPEAVPAPIVPSPPVQNVAVPEEAAPPPPKAAAPKPVAKPAHKPAAHRQVAAGYGSEPSAPAYYPPSAPAPCRDCAVVESTREIRVAGEGSGLGAVAGGVVGGLLGNRVGAGRGRTAATVLGAVGGGFAGNAIEKSSRAGMQHQLTVRFRDGTTQTFTRAEPWPFGSGDRVKVVNGQVVRD